METKELKAKTRLTQNGPSPNSLRREGFVPAVVYGYKKDSVPVTVNERDFNRLVKDGGHQSLISLAIDEGSVSKTVMLKEVQKHPVSGKIIHADFYEVDMNKKIATTVPVITTGVCKGEKEGGVLQLIRRELEVRCLPANIPESIEIDVSNLEIGDSIHVEDITVGEDIELLHDVNFTVISVAAPTKAEAEEPAEGEEEAEEEGVEAEAETESGDSAEE
ncbi:MAG: 50S ribosomal protein L25/general stress protein Ctc [Desulfococcus sp. 4484_241]|nr:MAG: 50S ribosomal protein L25/general stress protein Ctc [Desulfococcus sp. 4484_241]